MTDHLAISTLNALVDGELSTDQLASATEHLAGCQSCTASALSQSLLKSATARAGQRYTTPPNLQERLARIASYAGSQFETPKSRTPAPPLHFPRPFGFFRWVVAAALLLAAVTIGLVQRNGQRSQVASAQHSALVAEVCDQHVATLAASLPPQVLSTDRHTVKPWFQGKIPFSFNLPESLPQGTTLDGANLTYLANQPVAQLLYSIGKHRVSVFIRDKPPAQPDQAQAEHSGFHIRSFTTADLEVVAVSDVDPARLSELVRKIEDAQTGANPQSK